MGKIGQNPKIGQLWRLVASQPYVAQKSWLDLGNSLALGLQGGVNSISLQCIPWDVACSEWGTCLPTSKFGVLGANAPWIETFLKFLSKICVSLMIHVSWPNLAKIGRCQVAEIKSHLILLTKNPASGTLLSSPFRLNLTDRAQHFVNVVGPWPVHVYRLWSGSAAVCRTYSGKSP